MRKTAEEHRLYVLRWLISSTIRVASVAKGKEKIKLLNVLLFCQLRAYKTV